MICSLVTIGLWVASLIIDGFYAESLRCLLLPLFALAFTLVPDARRHFIVTHNIRRAIFYVIYVLWAVWAVIYLVQWITSGLSFYLPVSVAMMFAFIVNVLASGLYFHIYKVGAMLNSTDAPLLSTQV